MKMLSRLLLAFTLSIVFSSCSALERWGVTRPTFKVVDQHYVSFGHREFVVRRLLVTSNPSETILETLEVQKQLKTMAYTP